KVYRRSRIRGQVSSPTSTDEVNDGPNFSLGISQVSGEQNKKEQNKKQNKGSSHGLDMSTNEVIELRKELVKVNENNKALEEKIDLGFNQIKEFVVNSSKQLLEDISLLFAKSGGSSSVIREVREPSKKQAGETFSGGLDFNGEEDVAGIAIEKILSEVVADINVQEAADVNTVEAQPDDATEDCQKPLHTLDDFIFLDEDLSQINRTEESYLKKRATVDQNKKKVTPKKRGRKKNPGNFFETKHPFSYATGGDNESNLIVSFTKWLYMGTKKRGKKPYTDALNAINTTFELGVILPLLLNFLNDLSSEHLCVPFLRLKNSHIDIIFYYLRKKGKYEANSNVQFTTTDCVFKTKITTSFFQLCDAHENKKNYKVKDSDDIARDCGVFVVAFAEFVSNGQHILNQQVKADILRKRFGAILWEYARRKQASDLQSEDERPDR
ncbi:hypothetical protein MTR67_007865, partial [Solanum verrucosum]